VGIDLLISEADIAKATFYRHFPSKVDLIVAYVDRRHEAWMAWLEESVAARAAEPLDRMLAIFDALAEQFVDPEFRGSAIINAVAEAGVEAPEVLAAAVGHQAAIERYVAGLAHGAGLAYADELAKEWMLLIDGAFVAAQRSPGPAAALAARRTAQLLLEVPRSDPGNVKRPRAVKPRSR
jgi:AcrR family transcriptional regulator